VNVYDAASGRTLVQAEGLQMRMVGEPDAAHDRPVFAKTVWARDFAAMGGLLQEPDRDAAQDAELLALSEACERVALFYARRLVDDLETAGDDRTAFQLQHQRFLEALDWHLALVAKGEHPVLRREWLADGPGMLRKMDAAHPGAVQLHMLHALGSKYTSIIRGEVNQLEVMTKDDLLNRFYMEDLECIRINQFLASALRQITVKYPRCNILEIGAGTGGTTWTALNNIDDAYASYTYTDVSSAFLSGAAEKFADFSTKMIFKTLDIDNDPAAQGYAPHSYDIVIAANVLHATRDLTRTMRHVSSMLRPGGYLLLFETTGVQTLSIPFIFGGLSSWWASEEADRNMGPIVRPLRWDAILQDSGFSGLDMIAYDTGVEARHTTALLVSQAVNDTVLRLREPLADLAAIPGPDALLLIGGKKLATAKMLAEIQKLLPRAWRRYIEIADSIDAAGVARINPGTDIICLQDQDEPLFATTMTPPRLLALQGLLMKARNLLWVTSATTAKAHAPRATMFHGIARVAPVEMPHLNLQVLGLEAGLAPATAARHWERRQRLWLVAIKTVTRGCCCGRGSSRSRCLRPARP
jgi:SAM-dependent methyltransferase